MLENRITFVLEIIANTGRAIECYGYYKQRLFKEKSKHIRSHPKFHLVKEYNRKWKWIEKEFAKKDEEGGYFLWEDMEISKYVGMNEETKQLEREMEQGMRERRKRKKDKQNK